MSYDNLVIINEGLEERRSKTGKKRFSVRIEAEPLIFNVDPKALGAPVAKAIVQHLKTAVASISVNASKATLAAREKEKKAFDRGAAWAVRRFSGGRMGATPPKDGERRAFNHSGRFVDSITANASRDGAWRVNVAANRLDAKTSNNVQRIWERLRELVPEFADAGQLMSKPIVASAIRQAQQAMITKGKARAGKASAWDLATAAAQLVRTAVDIIDDITA